MSIDTTARTRAYGHIIDGQNEPAPKVGIERVSPANHQLVATFADGSAADTGRAIAAARQAFDHGPWPRMSGLERSRVLQLWADAIDRHVDLLTRIEIEEVGKPRLQAQGDIQGAAGHIRHAAALAATAHGEAYTMGDGYTGLVLRDPAGVVGMILPWNFPAFIYGQKVPYALAAGCCVALKPSEWTSGTALEMSRLGNEAGLPDGVLNVVTGYGDPVGHALVHSTEVDLLSFTGSTATGAKVLDGQKSNFKRVALELGGKGATIVFPDADLDEAVEAAVFGAFLNAGEECGSTPRLLVHADIADTLVDRVVARTAELVVGDPFDERTDIGALIHPQHVEKVKSYLKKAPEEGATLRYGGQMIEGAGLVMIPAVFDRVEPGTSLFRDEVFGPLLSVTRFTSTEEAITLANDTTYGLTNSVFSRDIDTALNVARALRSGTVWVNTTLDGSPQMPYGGYKASGHGREGGQAGLDEFTEIKALQIRTAKRPPVFSTPQAGPVH